MVVVVVCGGGNVGVCVFVRSGGDVDIIVVSDGSLGLVLVVSGSLGTKMTNFNTRETITSIIIKTITQMQIITVLRRCHHLCRPLFPVTPSLCT